MYFRVSYAFRSGPWKWLLLRPEKYGHNGSSPIRHDLTIIETNTNPENPIKIRLVDQASIEKKCPVRMDDGFNPSEMYAQLQSVFQLPSRKAPHTKAASHDAQKAWSTSGFQPSMMRRRRALQGTTALTLFLEALVRSGCTMMYSAAGIALTSPVFVLEWQLDRVRCRPAAVKLPWLPSLVSPNIPLRHPQIPVDSMSLA